MRRQSPLILLFTLLVSQGLSAQAAPSTRTPAAVLQPGDVLKIEIWREENLSGEFLVDEAGRVTLPLLGNRLVGGMTLTAVRDTLLIAYRKELRNPSISIIPLRTVYILGEVNEPGRYEVDPTVSLAGAIALAGGASQQGDLDKIRVIREGEVILRGVRAEEALDRIDIRSGDQIFVDERGWFERNSTFLVSASLGVVSIIISIIR
jgi:protein involved in polysaccharide export with SLBB domain